MEYVIGLTHFIALERRPASMRVAMTFVASQHIGQTNGEGTVVILTRDSHYLLRSRA
ncbi:MAG: hypothetical protein NVS4B9_34890 [Ktedonobacteraceae bacterium]